VTLLESLLAPMTVYQRIAFTLPCTVYEDFNRAEIIGPTTHWERGFRVAVIVDAVDSSAGVAERWPAWHVNVTLQGELASPRRRDKGKGHQARPLGSWGSLRAKEAMHVVRRELAGVGYEDTETLVDVPAALKNWRLWCLSHPEAQGQPPVAVYGRRRMTQDEAEECFATRREVLVRLNPTYGLLNQVGA
jgi:hypothetical protein